MFELPTMEMKKCNPNARIPIISVEYSAGYDLFSTKSEMVKPGATIIIPTGIALKIPKGYFGKIYSRSGMSYKKDIDVYAGVIDSQYLGEIKVIVKRRPKMLWSVFQYTGINSICRILSVKPYGEVKIKEGDRIAQIVFHKFYMFDFDEVSHFGEATTRGKYGFGHSGF